MPHFVDTNVLLCSISTHPAEAAKRDQAVALLDEDDGALSIRVLQEFSVQATRPTRPDRLSHQHAVALVDIWRRRLQLKEMTPPCVRHCPADQGAVPVVILG